MAKAARSGLLKFFRFKTQISAACQPALTPLLFQSQSEGPLDKIYMFTGCLDCVLRFPFDDCTPQLRMRVQEHLARARNGLEKFAVVENALSRQLKDIGHQGDHLGFMADIADRGVQRGPHMLKALFLGATAVSFDRLCLYPLAAACQKGVEWALGLMHAVLEQGMKLMGVTRVDQLSRANLRFKHISEAPQIRLAAE